MRGVGPKTATWLVGLGLRLSPVLVISDITLCLKGCQRKAVHITDGNSTNLPTRLSLPALIQAARASAEIVLAPAVRVS